MPTDGPSNSVEAQEQQVYRKRRCIWEGELDTDDSHEKSCHREDSPTQADMVQLSQTPWVDCYALFIVLCWIQDEQFHHKVLSKRCTSPTGRDDMYGREGWTLLNPMRCPLPKRTLLHKKTWYNCRRLHELTVTHYSQSCVEYMYSHTTHYSNTCTHRSSPTGMTERDQGVQVSMRL